MIHAVVSVLLLTSDPAGAASSVRDAAPAVADHARSLSYEDAERDGRRTLGQLPRNLGRSFVVGASLSW